MEMVDTAGSVAFAERVEVAEIVSARRRRTWRMVLSDCGWWREWVASSAGGLRESSNGKGGVDRWGWRGGMVALRMEKGWGGRSRCRVWRDSVGVHGGGCWYFGWVGMKRVEMADVVTKVERVRGWGCTGMPGASDGWMV